MQALHDVSTERNWEPCEFRVSGCHCGPCRAMQVMNDTESLLGDLDALFFNSWARPGDDLQPEIM